MFFTVAWSGGVTFVPLKMVGAFVPLRVSQQQKLEGLDISRHAAGFTHPNTFRLLSP
jgi:ammonia channel protein AmtB